MFLPSITLKALRDLRWQVFWYGTGLALMGALVAYLYPDYSDQFAGFEMPDALRGFLGEADFTTPEGFLGAEFFSWTPALLAVFAIMAGTSALAGEEVDGTLDLLLAQPTTRTRLVLEKAIALGVGAMAIALLATLGWLVSVPFVPELDISWARLLLATALLAPFTLLFALMALWAGAAFSTRGAATGFVTAVAVVSYFINYLANIVDAMVPLRWLSVFHYYDGTGILVSGPDLGKVAVVLVLPVVFGLMAIGSFVRRDIGVREGGIILPRLNLRAR